MLIRLGLNPSPLGLGLGLVNQQFKTGNLVTYEYVKVNLYMWMKVTTHTCGTEFLSPA